MEEIEGHEDILEPRADLELALLVYHLGERGHILHEEVDCVPGQARSVVLENRRVPDSLQTLQDKHLFKVNQI